MTALEAQNHPWLLTDAKVDLLPNVRKNFNAKTSLRKAILAVQMMNKLKTADTPSLSE
jgi:calcium/calmodulin-dependent protein kinase I